MPLVQAPGAAAASTVISFAQKTFANGNLTSKLHVIELGAAPGPHLCAPQTAPAQAILPLLSCSILLPDTAQESCCKHWRACRQSNKL